MTRSLVEELERRAKEFIKLLGHLLSLRDHAGNQIISGELMLQEMMERIEARGDWAGPECTPQDLIDYVNNGGQSPLDNGVEFRLYLDLHFEYRKLVCGIGQPDWLCATASSPRYLHPDYPVHFTDRKGGREYRIEMKVIPVENN